MECANGSKRWQQDSRPSPIIRPHSHKSCTQCHMVAERVRHRINKLRSNVCHHRHSDRQVTTTMHYKSLYNKSTLPHQQWSFCSGDRIHRYEHKGAGLLTALSSVTPNGDDNLMLVGSKDQVLVWDVRSDSKSWRSARSSMGQVSCV